MLELPAVLDERDDGVEGSEFGVLEVGLGKVSVGTGGVCLGKGGGEGGDELVRCCVVEGDAPGGRAEAVAVGVDPPQTVVVSLGQKPESDAVVGRSEVGVAEIIVMQVEAECEERLQRGVCDGGAAGEVAGETQTSPSISSVSGTKVLGSVLIVGRAVRSQERALSARTGSNCRSKSAGWPV